MAFPRVHAVGQTSNGTGTAHPIVMPVGAQPIVAGDILVSVMAWKQGMTSGTVPWPGGWVQKAYSASVFMPALEVRCKIAVGGETDFTITTGVSTDAMGLTFHLRSTAGVMPEGVVGAESGFAFITTIPGITPSWGAAMNLIMEATLHTGVSGPGSQPIDSDQEPRDGMVYGTHTWRAQGRSLIVAFGRTDRAVYTPNPSALSSGYWTNPGSGGVVAATLVIQGTAAGEDGPYIIGSTHSDLALTTTPTIRIPVGTGPDELLLHIIGSGYHPTNSAGAEAVEFTWPLGWVEYFAANHFSGGGGGATGLRFQGRYRVTDGTEVNQAITLPGAVTARRFPFITLRIVNFPTTPIAAVLGPTQAGANPSIAANPPNLIALQPAMWFAMACTPANLSGYMGEATWPANYTLADVGPNGGIQIRQGYRRSDSSWGAIFLASRLSPVSPEDPATFTLTRTVELLSNVAAVTAALGFAPPPVPTPPPRGPAVWRWSVRDVRLAGMPGAAFPVQVTAKRVAVVLDE